MRFFQLLIQSSAALIHLWTVSSPGEREGAHAFEASDAIAAGVAELAGEWEAVIALTGRVVEAQEAREDAIRAAVSSPDHPLAAWTSALGWARLAKSVRTGTTISPLPNDGL